jgi:hypothetical protein
MHRIISYPIVWLFAVAILACTVQPVQDDTISAEMSFSDFSGIKVSVGQAMPDFTLPGGMHSVHTSPDPVAGHAGTNTGGWREQAIGWRRIYNGESRRDHSR